MAGHQVSDGAEAIEYAYEQGWSDGLPVVPPTPDRIGRMLDALNYSPDEEIGRVVERERVITAGHVAANAVMAGCMDDLFPVVMAAVEALLDPRFNVIGPTASTGGSAPLVIVHGPIVKALRFNSGPSALGSGNRSNLTLGRALNLVVRNACGSVPGHLDQSTLGHPGKISYCLAEGPPGPLVHAGRRVGSPLRHQCGHRICRGSSSLRGRSCQRRAGWFDAALHKSGTSHQLRGRRDRGGLVSRTPSDLPARRLESRRFLRSALQR